MIMNGVYRNLEHPFIHGPRKRLLQLHQIGLEKVVRMWMMKGVPPWGTALANREIISYLVKGGA